jgi:hypothetical protein
MDRIERVSMLHAVAMPGLLVLAIGAGCRSPSEPALAPLSREGLDEVRTVFNGRGSGPRMLVFFSSGCASCDTGSAALEEMLGRLDAPATVLAVWEPISASDPPPTGHMLGNLKDRRVHQIWDPSHIMSDEMRAAEFAHPGSLPQARTRTDSSPDGIMYDTAAIFARGARWDTTLPAPSYLEVGVEAILPDLHAQLAAMSHAK